MTLNWARIRRARRRLGTRQIARIRRFYFYVRVGVHASGLLNIPGLRRPAQYRVSLRHRLRDRLSRGGIFADRPLEVGPACILVARYDRPQATLPARNRTELQEAQFNYRWLFCDSDSD